MNIPSNNPAKRLKVDDSMPLNVKLKEPPAEIELILHLSVSDDSFGISLFRTDLINKMKGIIKQRYSDFIVHEIDVFNNICYYTNEIEDFKSPEIISNSSSVNEEFFVQLSSLIESSDLSDLRDFFISQASSSSRASYKTSPILDKSTRSKIHNSIRKYFPNFSSETDSMKSIIVLNCPSTRWCSKSRFINPLEYDYLQFSLYKENVNTLHCINMIANRLGIKLSRFGFAGTKDKRAVTTQLVTGYRITPEQLNSCKSLNKIRVGNFKFVKDQLRLGDLRGNRFSIAIKDIDLDNIVIENNIHTLKSNGFINYYGRQRFGSYSIPTFRIGQAILQSNYLLAIWEILLSSNNEVDDTTAKEYLRSSLNINESLLLFPKSSIIEKTILKSLLKDPSNYVRALMNLSRNSRLMYIHAYQSYIWNRLTTIRLSKYGFIPIEGDLVKDREKTPLSLETRGDTRAITEDNEDVETKISVKFITKEDLEKCLYSIYDVYLPMISFDSILPNNEMGEIAISLLKEDGITMQDFDHKINQFKSFTTYRKIISRFNYISHRIVNYNNIEDQLIPTDLNIMQGHKLENEIESGSHMKKALIIEFDLEKGEYATMALRELLH